MASADPSNLIQYRVQRHFTEHRAVSPGSAIEYAPPVRSSARRSTGCATPA